MAKHVRPQVSYVDRRALAEIRAFSSPNSLISTYYLDLDAELSGTTEGMRIEARKVLAHQRKAIADLEASGTARHGLVRDWNSIFEPALLAPGERRTRSIACFVSSSAGMARVVRLPWPVRDRVFYEHQFVVWPLEEVLDQADRYAVCLTDKDDARIYFYQFEQIEPVATISDKVPGKIRFPSTYGERNYLGKHQRHVHYHFARVADQLLKLFRRRPFDHLIIGGLWEVLPEFEQHLHRYLSERIVARWDIDVSTPEEHVKRHTLDEEALFLENQRGEAWLAIHDVPQNRRAIGLEETLEALWLQLVDTMLVDPSAAARGACCDWCGRMQPTGNKCVECGAGTHPVANLFDEAEHAALEQSAHVRYWKNKEFQSEGSIAALTRI